MRPGILLLPHLSMSWWKKIIANQQSHAECTSHLCHCSRLTLAHKQSYCAMQMILQKSCRLKRFRIANMNSHAYLRYPSAAMAAWAQCLILLAHGPRRPSPLLWWPTGPPPALAARVPLACTGWGLYRTLPHGQPWGPTRRTDDGWAVVHKTTPDGLTARRRACTA